MTTTPGTYDITIYQGTSFSRVLTWKDESGTAINLSGYTARLHMRETIDATSPFLTLTTENGGITLGGAAGTITLSITPTDSSAITASGGVYDLELISGGGTVTRLLQGNIIINREVTR